MSNFVCYLYYLQFHYQFRNMQDYVISLEISVTDFGLAIHAVV
jgi:hypothetical protein